MDTATVAAHLERMATLMELKGENPFKIKAFANGAHLVEGIEEDLTTLVREGRLRTIKGIGPGLAAVITELVTEGRSTEEEALGADVPSGLFELLELPQFGPKKVKAVHEGLGVSSVGELEYACLENRLATLPGFGAKTQDKVLAAIALWKRSRGRHLLSDALTAAESLAAALADRAGVAIAIAGEVRRRCETVASVVLVAGSDRPAKLLDAFCSLPDLRDASREGDAATARLESGLPVTLRVASPPRYGWLLVEATGSPDHVTTLAARANERGVSLDQPSEEAVYAALGLAFLPPELREGLDDAALLAGDPLPHLIEDSDLQGLFHVHTSASDGAATLRQMAEAARALGYRYLGISDHSQAATYAHGLTPDRVREQHAEIDQLNSQLDGLTLLKGIEADILADGAIDYDDQVLATFDFVIASVHSRFGLDRAAMTERLIRAVRHPRVTMLGHPTGRLLLAREPYDVDLEAVFREAAAHGVAIELNSNPHRLDLDWRLLRRALELGVTIAISPDAHSVKGLQDVRYGVGVARKAGVTPTDVLNARPLVELRLPR